MHVLAIRHEQQINGRHQFTVQRLSDDFRSARAVGIDDPMARRVEATDLLLGNELTWYLEAYLTFPFGANAERAERVVNALRVWGADAFTALFSSGQARNVYREAVRDHHKNLQIQIFSDSPAVLAWPWEALHDPQIGDLAHHCRIERCLNRIHDPCPLPEGLPHDRIGILLVTARPYTDDIDYRSISRLLVSLIAERGLPAKVTLLRPPTLERLRQELANNPNIYHIVHFDGHGGFGKIGQSRDEPGAPHGHLVFENEQAEPDLVSGDRFSEILREHCIPIAVLNACQSAMINNGVESAFSSVATSLQRAGVRSVVAMSHSLYATAARAFLPAFYERLFASGNVAEAVQAGRQSMLARSERRPGFELADWIVPVLYQQQPLELDFASRPADSEIIDALRIPEEAQLGPEDPFGLIGRDSAVLALERASHRDPAGLLVYGLGGVGKTTLARGYIDWLAHTGGLSHRPIWLSFVNVRSADQALNRLVEALFGSSAMALPDDEKWPKLVEALRATPCLIVWDNFESASGPAGQEGDALGVMPKADLRSLREFLEQLNGGKTKVLVTSRNDEAWLGNTACSRVPLSGLRGEERIELAAAILAELGKTFDTQDVALANLIDSLGGHPLMMRAILSKLGQESIADIANSLDTYAPEIGGADQVEQRLYAMYRFVEDGLSDTEKAILYPIGLHEGYIFIEQLAGIANAVDQRLTADHVASTLAALQYAGMIRHFGTEICEVHPGLTRYLRARFPALMSPEIAVRWRQAFVELMAFMADEFAFDQFARQRALFPLFGPNFHQARAMAREDFRANAALTQALASYAFNCGELSSAALYFVELAQLYEDNGQIGDLAGPYHQLGFIEQRRRRFDEAERWFMKALEIELRFDDWAGAGKAYHHLGMIATERYAYDDAERWYLKSLSIKQEIGDEATSASTYHQLGILAARRGDFDTAEDRYQKSLRIKEKINDEHGSALSAHQLGRIAELQLKYDEAERWYIYSLSIELRVGSEDDIANSYLQLGGLSFKRHNLPMAENYTIEALRRLERSENEAGTASAYHQMGLVASQRGDLSAARRWLDSSLEMEERIGNERGAAMTKAALGAVAESDDNYDFAKRCYEEALTTFISLGATELIGPLVRKLTIINMNMEQYGPEKSFHSLDPDRHVGDLGNPPPINVILDRDERGRTDRYALPNFSPSAQSKTGHSVRFFFATCRKGGDEPGVLFSHERAMSNTFGVAKVHVPPIRRYGSLSRPFKFSVFSLKLFEAETNPETHFVIEDVEIRSVEEWRRLISIAGTDDALVFVHGFNTSFSDAVYRAGQIFWDLQFDGLPVLFSWASSGRVLDYIYDKDSALHGGAHFLDLLRELSESGIQRVYVLAHSMGSYLLINALDDHDHESCPLNIAELIMAAPDVDRDLFLQKIPKLCSVIPGLTLYASSVDKALWLSKQAARRDVPRAGDVPYDGPILVTGVDTIDVTAIGAELFGSGHGAYSSVPSVLNDIGLLIGSRLRPPNRRLAQLRCMPDGAAPPKWWRFAD